MNIKRYATLLMMISDNEKMAEHYRSIGLSKVAQELDKNRDKYKKEIQENLVDIVWYDEDEVAQAIFDCGGDWTKTGESKAMSDKYNRMIKGDNK